MTPTQIRGTLGQRLDRVRADLARCLDNGGDMLLLVPEGWDGGGRWGAIASVNYNPLAPWWGEQNLGLPLSARTAFDVFSNALPSLAEELATSIERTAELLIPDESVRAAVLDRPGIVEDWPWPTPPSFSSATGRFIPYVNSRADDPPVPQPHPLNALGWDGMFLFVSLHRSIDDLTETDEQKENASPLPPWAQYPRRIPRAHVDVFKWQHWTPLWPPDVAPLDVAQWAREPLNSGVYEGTGDRLLATVEGNLYPFQMRFSSGHSLPTFGLGLLYSAMCDVERNRRRPAVYLDASREHHAMVTGMVALTKCPQVEHRFGKPIDGRVMLLAPNRTIQLTLDLGLAESMVATIRDWRGAMGLRNWTALQRLFSIEGGRSGQVRWTLDDHLAALGYSASKRRDPVVREKVAAEVEAWTKIEIAVLDRTGQTRERSHVLVTLKTREKLQGSRWNLDGLVLAINPALYSGVRDVESGELGSNFYPASEALARVDHVRHPGAHALGLLLPMRWRYAMGEDGRDYVTLTGAHVLELAGIKYRSHDPMRAWTALHRDLDELQRIDPPSLERYEWREGTPGLSNMITLYAPEWAVDRTIRKIAPLESPPGPAVLTGRELLAWRKGRGLSQTEAAAALGVSQATVSRAERRELDRIDPRLSRLLRERG